jgi:hypothetical protein
VLERGQPDHVCCVLGDWRGNGQVGLVTGNFALPRASTPKTTEQPLITVWENAAAEDGGE